MAVVRAWRTEPPVRLTQREFVLAALFSAGAAARQAAAILGIQFGTFHSQRARVRDKFAAAGIPAGSRIELGVKRNALTRAMRRTAAAAGADAPGPE